MNDSIPKISTDAQAKMEKSILALKHEFTKIRSGRANPALLENVMVSYYGVDTPLKQVANIVVEDSRTLMVTPWEKNLVSAIEKGILTSDLGLNPATSGTAIRVPLPALNEERRREMVKITRNESENAKVSIRNVRRDANALIKDLLKAKKISEDESKKSEEGIQKLTDRFIKEVDQLLAHKEAELMEV